MPSLASHVTNLIFRLMPAYKEGQEHDYLAERKANAARKPERKPKDVVLEEFDLNGLTAEKITKTGNNNGLIFYIHGGGFTTGSALERRMLTYYVVNKYGYNCISINYRLAPENKWPAQIDDCYTAYENVLKMGYKPEDIIFMGESAGGTLVLALALMVKDRGMPQPKAIVAFSPATDNCEDLPSHKNNIKTDYMLTDAVSRGIADVLFDHKPTEEELKQYLLSPLYGNYEGIAPIHLSASVTETLYDDALFLYDKLRKEEHEVGFDSKHGVCHAYQIMTYMPEAKQTLNKVFTFIENIEKKQRG